MVVRMVVSSAMRPTVAAGRTITPRKGS